MGRKYMYSYFARRMTSSHGDLLLDIHVVMVWHCINKKQVDKPWELEIGQKRESIIGKLSDLQPPSTHHVHHKNPRSPGNLFIFQSTMKTHLVFRSSTHAATPPSRSTSIPQKVKIASVN